MADPEILEIEGWKCTRYGFSADADHESWTMTLHFDDAELDISCDYGATDCSVPLAVIQQLQAWHEDSRKKLEEENG